MSPERRRDAYALDRLPDDGCFASQLLPVGEGCPNQLSRALPQVPASALQHHGQRRRPMPRPGLTRHRLTKRGRGHQGHGASSAGLGAEGRAELRWFWSQSVEALLCEACASRSRKLQVTPRRVPLSYNLISVFRK